MPGGARPGAGRKSGWQHSETQTIRVPVALAEQVLAYARRLDAGEDGSVTDSKDYVTDSSAAQAVALLEAELERLTNDRKATPKRQVLRDVVAVLKGEA